VRTLVTGATGFIGVEVVRQLAEAGARPRVLVRRMSRAPLVAGMDVEPVFGDLDAPRSLARAVAGVDAVIHLAGRATFEPYDRVAPSLVGGTERLAAAAAEAGVARIVFGSSAFVYAGSTTDVVDDTPTQPAFGYGRAKLEAERALERGAAGGGPAAASIRLPHVYGPQSLLFGLVRRGVVPFPGDGRNRFAQLHVEDAARLLVAAARSDWTGALPAADHHTVTWQEFFEVLTTYAPRTRVVHLPAGASALAARAGGSLLGRLGPTMVSPDTVRGWNTELAVASRTVWDRLAVEPRYPSVLAGIPAVLDGVVAFRWRHPVNDFS
jgi:nucleoside-diphosphate-sugar epimerase